MDSIGYNIRKLRELKNLTQEFLAKELGMTQSSYSKIETGESDLAVSKLYKISEIIGVDVSQILEFDASHVFNISNNKLVQGLSARVENMYFTRDEYREKYVQMLEAEIERLKKQLDEKA